MIKKCPACDGKVYIKLNTCPHCGYPFDYDDEDDYDEDYTIEFGIRTGVKRLPTL